MATISRLSVDLVANSAKLVSELQKSRKRVNSWASNIRKQANVVGKFFVATAAAASAAIIAIVNGQAAAIDQLAKKARQFDIDVSALQKLRFEVEQTSELAGGQFDMAMQRMMRRVSEAANGTGEAKDAIKELGLEAVELARMKVDQQFYTVAQAMKSVASEGDRTRLAMKLFDSEGVALVNTLTADLGTLGAEFDTLGITISSQQAAMVEAYNDSKNKLGTIWDGFLNHLTVRVAPAFQDLVMWAQSVTTEMGGMGNVATGALEKIASGVAFVSDGLRGLKILILTIHQGIGKMAAVLIESIRSIENVYIDMMKLIGQDVKASVTLKADAEQEKKWIGERQAQIDELLHGELASSKVKDYFAQLNERVAAVSTQMPAVVTANQNLASAAEKGAEALTKLYESTGGGGKSSGGESDLFKKLFPERKRGSGREIENFQFQSYARAAGARLREGNGTAFDQQISRAREAYERARNATSINYNLEGMEDVLKRLTQAAANIPRVESKGSGVIATGGKTTGVPEFKGGIGTMVIEFPSGEKKSVTGAVDDLTEFARQLSREAAATGVRG